MKLLDKHLKPFLTSSLGPEPKEAPIDVFMASSVPLLSLLALRIRLISIN
jgi:hypothetical protein